MTNAADVTNHLKTQLKFAQRDFAKNPNAIYWLNTIAAMFVWQQWAQFSKKRSHAEVVEMSDQLGKTPMGEWGNVICQAMFGKGLWATLRDNQLA